MGGGRAGVGVALALACVLGGCGLGGDAPTGTQVSSSVLAHFRGGPRGVRFPSVPARSFTPRPFAAWAGPGRFYVITWGSGSCPEIPMFVVALHRDLVEVRTVVHDFYSGDNGCSADLGPTTSVVAVPALIDERHPVRVWIDGTTTRLPAR